MKKQRRKTVQKIGSSLVILDPQTLFSELTMHPTRYVAKKHNVSRRALVYRLREIDERKYEEIISKRRTRKNQMRKSVPEDTWTKLASGRSLRSIALEHNLTPSVFHLQAREDDKYELAIRQQREHYNQQMQEAARQFKQGMRLAALSKYYRTSQQTLANEIRQIIGDKAYARILYERRRNPSNKISLSIVKMAATRFEQGTRITQLSNEYGIDRCTLRRRLLNLLGIEYYRIIKKRRVSRDLILRIVRKFKNGASLIELSNDFRVPLTTLCRRLSTILGRRYKDIVKRKLRLSLRSRGGDSLFERHVEAVLVQNEIPFKKLVILEIKGHKYRPDFMIYAVNPPLIIEATGMNRDDYWEKIGRKLEEYLQEGYYVLCVLPNQKSVLKKATRHVSGDLLIELNDFSELIRSLGRMPSEKTEYDELPDETRPMTTDCHDRVMCGNPLLYLQKKGKVRCRHLTSGTLSCQFPTSSMQS